MDLPDYTNGSDAHYHDLLGYKITEWEEGHARLEMAVQERHRNRGDYTHGGILMGLLDISALFSGIHGRRGQVDVLTISLSCNFTAAVFSERLAAIGTLRRAGHKTFFADSKIIDIATDTLLATGQGAFRTKPR